MPPSTKNLVPLIVYLPQEAKKALDALAEANFSNASAEARRILVPALRKA